MAPSTDSQRDFLLSFSVCGGAGVGGVDAGDENFHAAEAAQICLNFRF